MRRKSCVKAANDNHTTPEVMDGLMDTLKVVNPKVYESIMRKIRAL